MDSKALPPWKKPESEWRKTVETVRAGRSLRPASWPEDASWAVALSFDCDHECFELGQGNGTVGRLSWGEFGRRVGVPRILDVLGRHAIPATFFVPAVCSMLDPSEIPRIAGDGHEIGMHGYIHENNSLLDEKTERELMLRARDELSSRLGADPVGFRSPNWDLSPYTIEIVRDMGIAYDSSLMADESCYELVCNGEPSGVIEIPVEWLRDDAVYLLFNRQPATRPWLTPEGVFDIFRRELEAARAEGGLFQLVMHPFVIGYRSRIWILDELIGHAKALGGAWFGSHAEVAQWVGKHGE